MSALAYLGHWARYRLLHRMEHLVLHVTGRCNLRCAHCFVDFAPRADLPLERYRRLAEEVGRFFWLDIGGGEPFLRDDLPEIVEPFRCRVLHIPTNGLATDAIVESVREIRRRTRAQLTISVSIDGLEATHDEIRGRSGAWQQAWKTFDALRGLNVSLRINTVLMRRNAGEIIPLMHEVRRRNPDFHSVCFHRGHANDPIFALPDLEQVSELAGGIFEILDTYDYGQGWLTARVLRNYHRYLWKLSVETLQQQRQVIPCLAGRAHLAVLGDGSVSSCEMLPGVGSIATQSWAEILAGEPFRRQVSMIRRGGCFCTHNCAMLDNILMRLRSFGPLMHQCRPHGVAEERRHD
ncbi:MAG: radical SAM protein [Planctomycetaceae bacterium]|nr:radical SAM protein [Planctomycetaceae bacterium]